MNFNMKIFSTNNQFNAPVFIWEQDPSHGENARQLLEEIKSLSDKDFSIVVFEISDWNAQLSPWKAPALFGKQDFAGMGIETLKTMENDFIPKIKETFPESNIYLAGYSLAGLFSLWALYESDKFDGAVCCSSSLWFENWNEYAASHKIKISANIYMSLGKREEKSKNQIMSKVGDRTRMQIDFLKIDPNVQTLNFEWNEGGHFDEPLKRLAKGIVYILEN